MTTMIERLCRAVYRKRLGFLGDPKEEAWRMYEGEVRELLGELREPTETMMQADGHSRPIWQSMIDAILAEKP